MFVFMRRSCYRQCACDEFIDGLLVNMVCIRLNRTKPSANAGFAWDDTKSYTVPDAAGTCCLLSDCVSFHCSYGGVAAGLRVCCFQSYIFSGKYS